MTNKILIAVAIGLVVGLALGITIGVMVSLPSESNNLPSPSPVLTSTPVATPQQNQAINLTDFTNYKISLLNYYNQQTTAHAGYIIALAVALFTILYQIKSDGFFKNRWLKRTVVFYFPISIILGAMLFFILRIIFWGWISSAVLGVAFNNPKVIPPNSLSGLQYYLCGKFQLGTGWTSLFYSIDKNHTGVTFVALATITFLLILGADFSYLNYPKKEGWRPFTIWRNRRQRLRDWLVRFKNYEKWGEYLSAWRYEWKNWRKHFWIVMVIVVGLLFILGFYSTWLVTILKHILNLPLA